MAKAESQWSALLNTDAVMLIKGDANLAQENGEKAE